jgi:hypothetical protein
MRLNQNVVSCARQKRLHSVDCNICYSHPTTTQGIGATRVPSHHARNNQAGQQQATTSEAAMQMHELQMHEC